MTDAFGVWVYAIAERGTDGLPGGVGGAPVRAADAGTGLVALISDVDLAEFGEDALRRNLENLDWLEGTARAHHRVIAAAARLFPLLPARLATVYTSDASMAAALTARDPHLRVALEQVRERSEWGVKAYAQPGPDSPGASAQPEGKSGTGMAYLRRRRDQLAAREDSQRATLASAQTIHSQLAACAAQARLHPPQAPQLSGASTPMILNAAYLLDDSRTQAFASAVAALSDQHRNLRLELTGPWPPYSFAGAE
jgi:hypothetical protein